MFRGLGYPVSEFELSDAKPQKPLHSALAQVAEAIQVTRPLLWYLGLNFWEQTRFPVLE